MSILLDKSSRVIIQGFTGDKGTFHAKEWIAYGTNVEEGKRLLKESGLKFSTADSMGEAAEQVVALAKGAR